VSKVDGRAVAIGITGFAECGALLDVSCDPLVPGFAWHDPRAELEKIKNSLGEEKFESTVAARITPVVSVAKILWQQQHFPRARNAHYFVSAPEYIMFTLGADLTNELSLVSRTGFLDISAKAPWLDSINLVGGGPEFLARLVGAGEVIGHASQSAPLNLRGAVLTIAGHDHQSAAYYLGAVKDGALFDSMGTAEAIVRTHKGSISRESISLLAKHGVNVGWTVIPNHQTILAGLPTGISLERLSTMLGATSIDERNALGHAATQVDRTHHEVKVDGTYTRLNIEGITDGLTPAHIWRAAVEDLTELYNNTLELISKEIGHYDQVTIAGGWIHNPMVKFSKEVQYKKFAIADKAEPGAMGAAEFAGVALGVIAPRWN
jgi:sugar (pentulose or hexulose) kinase